jgi:L-ascorbate metabolism protein UlaG (beta-lactamase superfamily)
MNRTLSFCLLVSILFAGVAGCSAPATPTPIPPTPTFSTQALVEKIHWFGTSSILYKGSKIIYFDPVTLNGTLPQADLILVTHGHSDHWSVADIKKIIGPNTILIISRNVPISSEASKSKLGIPAILLTEGQTTEVNGVSIQAVPAYGAGHPREAGGVGYIVGIDGVRIYMSGGTDAYPEMAQNTSDIAFIPVYSRALAQAMAQIIPAKVFVFEHTSFYAAQALATIFTKDVGAGKTFIGLQDGPYNP